MIIESDDKQPLPGGETDIPGDAPPSYGALDVVPPTPASGGHPERKAFKLIQIQLPTPRPISQVPHHSRQHQWEAHRPRVVQLRAQRTRLAGGTHDPPRTSLSRTRGRIWLCRVFCLLDLNPHILLRAVLANVGLWDKHDLAVAGYVSGATYAADTRRWAVPGTTRL